MKPFHSQNIHTQSIQIGSTVCKHSTIRVQQKTLFQTWKWLIHQLHWNDSYIIYACIHLMTISFYWSLFIRFLFCYSLGPVRILYFVVVAMKWWRESRRRYSMLKMLYKNHIKMILNAYMWKKNVECSWKNPNSFLAYT